MWRRRADTGGAWANYMEVGDKDVATLNAVINTVASASAIFVPYLGFALRSVQKIFDSLTPERELKRERHALAEHQMVPDHLGLCACRARTGSWMPTIMLSVVAKLVSGAIYGWDKNGRRRSLPLLVWCCFFLCAAAAACLYVCCRCMSPCVLPRPLLACAATASA